MFETSEGQGIVEDVVAPTSQLRLALASSDEEIDAYMRTFGATAYHSAGTAAWETLWMWI
jgi:hypothetical protein